MQNFRQVSKINMLSIPLLALVVMLLSSSCTKNAADKPVGDKTVVSNLNQSSQSRTNNGLAAVSFEETLFVPCANGGAGEWISLTGTTNFVYQISWNDHGFSLVYHDNSRGVTGVGLTSGETFVGSDGTQGSVMGSWVNNQWIGTTIEQMRIIGRNMAYVVKYKYQLIVTPDGKVTVSVREKTIECKS